MELDELSKSGIRRIADYSPYLDQLAGLAQQMGLRQRSNLTHVESALRSHWSLGQNSILSWVPLDQSILILVVPHYAIAEYTSVRDGAMPPRVSPRFITELISGDRQLTITQMQKVARLLDIEPTNIPLRVPLEGSEIETKIIEKMIRKYGINYVPSRAVTLFDIVGFSLLTPFEQMTQLNSLSYSLNSAHAKMLEADVNIDFARSSSGDGFYIWNRDEGLEAFDGGGRGGGVGQAVAVGVGGHVVSGYLRVGGPVGTIAAGRRLSIRLRVAILDPNHAATGRINGRIRQALVLNSYSKRDLFSIQILI